MGKNPQYSKNFKQYSEFMILIEARFGKRIEYYTVDPVLDKKQMTIMNVIEIQEVVLTIFMHGQNNIIKDMLYSD